MNFKSSRREFVTRYSLFATAAVTWSGLSLTAAQKTAAPAPVNYTPDEALKRLLAGNERFVKGQPASPRRSPEEFTVLAAAQYPEAVIVSCADSRVAPELLFDVGVGDIFVVRVAGNVVDGAGITVKGSIEYAVAELHVPLIFVLGHSSCGAVKAAIQHINAKDTLPGSIDGLVELIKPAVKKSQGMPGDLLTNAIAMNVRVGMERLNSSQAILAPKIKEGKLKVVGGVYDLKTGSVSLLQA